MSKRILSLILGLLLIFLAVSMVSYSPDDGPNALVFPKSISTGNLCGSAGTCCASILFAYFGLAAYFIFIPLIFVIVILFVGKSVDHISARFLGLSMILVGISALIAFSLSDKTFDSPVGPGGYVGAYLQFGLSRYFALIGCYIFAASIVLAGMVLSCEYSVVRIVLWVCGVTPIGHGIIAKIKQTETIEPEINEVWAESKPAEQEPIIQQTVPQKPIEERPKSRFSDLDTPKPYVEPVEEYYEPEEEYEEPYEEVEEVCEPESSPEMYESTEDEGESKSTIFKWFKLGGNDKKDEQSQPTEITEADNTAETETDPEYPAYSLPSVEHLIPQAPFDFEAYEATVKRQARRLKNALAAFDVNIEVTDIQTGPVITQFEIELERGTKLNKIQTLTDDLAIALKVPTVRIVHPIPGKNTVGVEIPNENRQIVRLREVIEETVDDASKMYIPIFLGDDVSGTPILIDLTKLPHLLIAGRTGTGKSVCLNSIIVSILMTRTPDEVRMLLIDPKVVELTSYKMIPHLMHPVVTDMRRAEAILGWAVIKMEERYQLLARAGVRQLSEFNKLTDDELYHRVKPESDEEWDNIPKTMPYLVIVVDEMADLMMSSGKEVESHIIRLAQKSRAVGIHLVLATQKPTVDVITGLIKSNLPARIAFEVASRSDSQVVLDRNGAEKLLGNGDMLFLKPGTSHVIRGQGTYVSDDEINAIVAEIATETPEYVEELVSLQIDEEDSESDSIATGNDAMYEKAVEYIIREGRGSGSLIQRKFGIGYNRASKMIERMAEDGIVGAYNGSQAREVILSLSEWRRRRDQMRNRDDEMDLVETPPPKPVGTRKPKLAVRNSPPHPASPPKKAPGQRARIVPELRRINPVHEPVYDEYETEQYSPDDAYDYEQYDEYYEDE